MPILAFDTTQAACSAAISHAGEVLSWRFEAMSRGHAERLMPMIEEVRQEAAVQFQEMEAVAVTLGPGTFTGVRVGLAAARALALVAEVPILGVSTLELLASAAAPRERGGIIAAIDARRGELYLQAFDSQGISVTEAAVCPAASFTPPATLAQGIIVGLGADILAPYLPEWQLDSNIQQPDARILALAAEGWAHRANRQPPAPIYLRAPDARLPAQPAGPSAGRHDV